MNNRNIININNTCTERTNDMTNTAELNYIRNNTTDTERMIDMTNNTDRLTLTVPDSLIRMDRLGLETFTFAYDVADNGATVYAKICVYGKLRKISGFYGDLYIVDLGSEDTEYVVSFNDESYEFMTAAEISELFIKKQSEIHRASYLRQGLSR
ncbi:MAG: hypothetical protein IK093_11835 [Ruminiclostridium sp.]|nr:hypothetical protein [Ruminiclostridium sp.]